MNEKIEELLELPSLHKVAIIFACVGLIAVIYWMNFYSPIADDLEKLTKKVDGRNGLAYQVAQQEAIAANLEKFSTEVARLNVELNKALAELPDKKEVGLLLQKVSDRAHDAGLEVRVFKPQSVEKKDFYAEVPVLVEVTGTYHQVATFFDEVGRLDRIVNLDNFDMKEPQVSEDVVSLTTSVVATAFRFLDEGERPNSEKGKGKRHRRKKKLK